MESVLRPVMESAAILDDVAEALRVYPAFAGRDVRTIAAVVAAIHEAGGSLPDSGFGLIYHRVVCRWQLRVERDEAIQVLGDDVFFTGVEVDIRFSCREAKRAFGNAIIRDADELPHLPLPGCSSPYCRCRYKFCRRKR